MPRSALKFHFLQITFFSAVITRTHNLPTHTPFFRPIMCKKRASHLFLKITFFALYSFSLPPKHFLIIFSGKLATKNGQKTSRKEEIFFFFFKSFFTFSLSSYRNKQNHLLFPPFLSSEIEKPQGKTSHKKFFFFFFFFYFFASYRSSESGKLPLTFFFEIPT